MEQELLGNKTKRVLVYLKYIFWAFLLFLGIYLLTPMSFYSMRQAADSEFKYYIKRNCMKHYSFNGPYLNLKDKNSICFEWYYRYLGDTGVLGVSVTPNSFEEASVYELPFNTPSTKVDTNLRLVLP